VIKLYRQLYDEVSSKNDARNKVRLVARRPAIDRSTALPHSRVRPDLLRGRACVLLAARLRRLLNTTCCWHDPVRTRTHARV